MAYRQPSPYSKRMGLHSADGLISVGKGRVAEAKVVAELVDQGVEVYLPTFGNGACDLVALCDGMLFKVETKYTTRLRVGYEVSLRQVRANRAQTTVKKFNAANSDVLAVYVAPVDRVAFLPSAPLHDRVSVTLRESVLDDYQEFRRAMTAGLPQYQPRGVCVAG